MNKNFHFIFLIVLLSINNSFAQRTFEIYQDDSIQTYFKKLGKENGFYYNINNIKDSLPDGKYILYNVNRKDSATKNKKIILIGQYVNYSRDGRFENNNYVYDKKEKVFKLCYQHICYYKEGKKNGVEEEYDLYSLDNKYKIKTMIFYGEYFEGKKHGLFMYYELGCPEEVIIYENDLIKQTYLNRICKYNY